MKPSNQYRVEQISRMECAKFILEIHYAKRYPSVSYAYGLKLDGELVGVITYGTPPSATLRRGIAGDSNIKSVLELNRLCLLNNLKNEASYLVSKSLKMLPTNKIIISFADTEQGHKGTVYQAANFTYHGLSAKRTNWMVKGMEHKHGQTIADEFRGVKNRAEAMRNKYGDDFYLKPRPRKHRYIYVVGDKKFKRKVRAEIKYPESSYPLK